MPDQKRIQFSTTIAAPVDKVYRLMIAPDTYREWTTAFDAESRYEGTWATGERIRFIGSNGHGMVSEIAEMRPNDFISIRHLGMLVNGVEDSTTTWSDMYENYTFQSVPEGTRLIVDQDVTPDFEKYLNESWPKALEQLKALCERK